MTTKEKMSDIVLSSVNRDHRKNNRGFKPKCLLGYKGVYVGGRGGGEGGTSIILART